MARLSILGANGQIGRSLIDRLADRHELVLYARAPDALDHALAWDEERLGASGRRPDVRPLEMFGREKSDAVINAAGPGDPARLRRLGTDILRITETLDNLVLDHLRGHPDTVYIYCSTGAVYGGYAHTVDADSRFSLPVNRLGPEHCYPLAKLVAEAKHRCLAPAPIVDIRIFGFVSHHIDPAGGFLLSEILRALRSGRPLETTRHNFIRDFIGPEELSDLIERILADEKTNGVCDAVSAQPLRKSELFESLAETFGLRYEIVDGTAFDSLALPDPGPLSRMGAQHRGCRPPRTALRIVLDQMAEILERKTHAWKPCGLTGKGLR